MAFYEVIVQNIGKVHEGGFIDTARDQFAVYKNRSIKGIGRAAGEGVTLWKDGEIMAEYSPDEPANVYSRREHRSAEETMYRILTEDKNRESIFRILDSHVDGYTVTPAIGSWRGQREASLAIDLVNVDGFIVEDIAAAIKATNEQESVLVLHFTAQSIFV